jgi:hypothetical protein
MGARGSVVGRGTMLQAGRSRDRSPVRSFNFSIDLINPSSRTMTLGSAQPLREMSFLESSWGVKWRPSRKADNLTAIFEPIV